MSAFLFAIGSFVGCHICWGRTVHFALRLYCVILDVVFGVCFPFPFEPPHDKTNKMACAPSEDTDQPGHPPSLIRVFAVRMKKAWFLSYPLSAQRRHCEDWADAQADPSLRWAHMQFRWFSHKAAHVLSMAGSGIRLHRSVHQLFHTIKSQVCLNA